MGFFETAHKAGAEAYGAARAEKYGRRAKAVRVIQLIGIVVLAIGIVYLWSIGQGEGA
jgi:hypothetical protein